MSTYFEKRSQITDDPYVLAESYEKKFRQADTATHQQWLLLFSKALERQVRSVLESGSRPDAFTKLLEARDRYIALWHCQLAAATLLQDNERRDLILSLRLPRNEARKTSIRKCAPHYPTPLHFTLDIQDTSIFQAIFAFL